MFDDDDDFNDAPAEDPNEPPASDDAGGDDDRAPSHGTDDDHDHVAAVHEADERDADEAEDDEDGTVEQTATTPSSKQIEPSGAQGDRGTDDVSGQLSTAPSPKTRDNDFIIVMGRRIHKSTFAAMLNADVGAQSSDRRYRFRGHSTIVERALRDHVPIPGVCVIHDGKISFVVGKGMFRWRGYLLVVPVVSSWDGRRATEQTATVTRDLVRSDQVRGIKEDQCEFVVTVPQGNARYNVTIPEQVASTAAEPHSRTTKRGK